jgi:hypothetical protein
VRSGGGYPGGQQVWLDDPPALLSVLDLTQTRELRGAQLPDGIFTLPRAEERGPAGAAVVVVDGIGVVVGMVTSPKTVKAMGEARDGVKRLIHRSGDKPQPSPETPEQKRAAEQEQRDRTAKTLEILERLNRNRPIPRPGPPSSPPGGRQGAHTPSRDSSVRSSNGIGRAPADGNAPWCAGTPRSTATGASAVPAPAGGHRSPQRICPRRARPTPADFRPDGSASLSLRAAAHRGPATEHHRR